MWVDFRQSTFTRQCMEADIVAKPAHDPSRFREASVLRLLYKRAERVGQLNFYKENFVNIITGADAFGS